MKKRHPSIASYRNIAYNLAIVVFLATALLACEKESTKNQGDISYYPRFDFNGDRLVSLALGETFSDPGVRAHEESQDDLPYTTTFTKRTVDPKSKELSINPVDQIDNQKAGFYTLTYIAENSYGYVDSAHRSILVRNTDTELSDLSGTYRKQQNSDYYMTISKISEGFYSVSNAYTDQTPIPIEIADLGMINDQRYWIIIPGYSTEFEDYYLGAGRIKDNGKRLIFDFWFADDPNTRRTEEWDYVQE